MDSLSRTGIEVPSADRLDPVHAVAAYRSIALALEAAGALYGQGGLGDRPSAGVEGRFWKVPDDTIPRIWYDDGTRWVQIGGDAPPADGPVDVASLRTLGHNHLQGSPGDHHHAESEVERLEPDLADIWAAIRALQGQTLFAIRNSDLNVTVADVWVDDTQLSIPVQSGATYELSGLLSVISSYCVTQLSAPAGSTGKFTFARDWSGPGGAVIISGSYNSDVYIVNNSVDLQVLDPFNTIAGVMKAGTTGTVRYRYKAAVNTPLTLGTNSFLTLRRVA